MKLFSFPAASLEKAIAKRILSLEPASRQWFTERWAQKPYKRAFVENKAMPLVMLIARGKTSDDETFDGELAEWDVQFYPVEVEVLRPIIDSPAYEARTFDEIPYLCASVVDDEASGRTTIFALNRHLEEDMELRVELRGLGKERVVEEALELFHANMKAVNTRDTPNAVAPTYNSDIRIEGDTLIAKLKPGSWNVLVTRANKETRV